jgi:hypothetical protein
VATNRRGVRIRICGDEILSNDSFSADEDVRNFRSVNNNNIVNKNYDARKQSRVILDDNKTDQESIL